MGWFRRWYQNLTSRRLADLGIMGMNCRNIRYISPYNSRTLFPLVDDKLQTKRLALEHDVNVPELIGVIEYQHSVKLFASLIQGYSGFCIKPAKGSGGKGILVIAKTEKGVYYRTNNQAVSLAEVQRHISNILAGLFSLGGKPDVAMIETLIDVDDAFLKYTHEGVPDLRVIVFRGFPIMAMMRLSCASSKGKANLHQGAVGVGIDIKTGQAVRAVQRGRAILQHPDTGQSLAQLQMPQWIAMLELACACYDMTGLGYLGVDLVLDKNRGPLLLELNARPGLSIQIANDSGLLPRLRVIEGIKRPERYSVFERVDYARNQFGVETTLPDLCLEPSY